jgi:hypothetical protein
MSNRTRFLANELLGFAGNAPQAKQVSSSPCASTWACRVHVRHRCWLGRSVLVVAGHVEETRLISPYSSPTLLVSSDSRHPSSSARPSLQPTAVL